MPPLSKEASWLLPFGLLSLALLAASTRPRWPLAPAHQAAVLWGGWLLTAGLIFSVAGFFHEYYLSLLAPPLAALVGLGAMRLWRLGRSRPWLAVDLLLIAAGLTLAVQIVTATSFVSLAWWLFAPMVLFVIGAAALLVVTGSKRDWISQAGFSCVVAALLITHAIWSGLTSAYPSANQSLPAAFDGQPSAPPGGNRLGVNSRLVDFLQANTQGQKYLVAMPSSMQGSDYVIATSRPVLYLGGFMGADAVVSPADLARLASTGQLRFVFWDARGRGRFGQQPNIAAWLTQNCRVVPGFEANTANSGAPGGLGAGGLGETGRAGLSASMVVSLYDCAP